MNSHLMKTRSEIITRTRNFFLERDYLETDTPILAPALIPESCLEIFKTQYVNPFLGNMDLYLVPSPEVWMKPIIAELGKSIFQISKCFRNAESIGRIHNPEFTMIEYYTVNADSGASAKITEELFLRCANKETPKNVLPPFRHMTVAEAFMEFTGFDLEALQDRNDMIEAARKMNMIINDKACWEDAYNAIFVNVVEPALPVDKPVILEQYPKQMECLAVEIPGTPWKDRWELYVNGIELANCYTEERNPEIIRRYFEKETIRKKNMLVQHKIDENYADTFLNFPSCSGVAMGFDRFILVLSGQNNMESVVNFPFKDTLEKWMPEYKKLVKK